MSADRGITRTELIAACDVVADDPCVRMALVVLPRRLHYLDLGPISVVLQEHGAQLQWRVDGGLDLIVPAPASALPGPPANTNSTHHAPAWVIHLIHKTEGMR